MPACCSGTCHSSNAFTPPSVLFVQSASLPHTRRHPLPVWVMACVDFLSLWEVVLHGLALSSCFHACPFNRLGNPNWYLYRPWFSWYRCSLPLLPHCNLSLSPSLSVSSIWLHLHYLQSLPTLSIPGLIMCCSSQVSIYSNSSYHHISTTLTKKKHPEQLRNCQNTSELRSVIARNKFCMVKQHESRELLSSLTEGWLVYRYKVSTSGRGERRNWFWL